MNRFPDAPISRRTALSLLGVGAAGLLAACSDSTGTAATSVSPTTADPSTTVSPTAVSPTTVSSTTVSPTTVSSTTVSSTTRAVGDAPTAQTPGETGGPFPADGSNDNGSGTIINILKDPRSMRTDIRSDLDGSNTQEGVPLTLNMRVAKVGGAPLAGAVVYVWHCNKVGQYSEYNSPMLGGDFTARSYLRGAQTADAAGAVTFTTVLPGRYQGRAFHIHYEVYSDTSYGTKLLTSQIAIDDALIDQLYSKAAYTSALKNETTNAQDNVFSDGVEHELLSMSGTVATGLTAAFTVGI
jgi:protocatechuate 3,4-dioxygenase beta subunit